MRLHLRLLAQCLYGIAVTLVVVLWILQRTLPPNGLEGEPRDGADHGVDSLTDGSGTHYGYRRTRASPSKRQHRRHGFAHSRLKRPPEWLSDVYYDTRSPPAEFRVWNSSATALCMSSSSSHFERSTVGRLNSRFFAYANLFAELRDVVVNRRYCLSDRKGGEMLYDVVGQPESSEFYRVEPGCFRLACSRTLDPDDEVMRYKFVGDAHLDVWLKRGVRFAGTGNTQIADDDENDDSRVAYCDAFTVAVVRYDYVNFYHTITDWYNAFLMMQFFGRTPADTNILLVDSHPFGALDPVWSRLFGSVNRLSALRPHTRFRQLVWNIVGYDSPLSSIPYVPGPPLLEEFRRHVLASYNINEDSAASTPLMRRNCSSLSVLFIWRRDYLAHPRNPAGRIQRKISNEAELVDYVERRRPGFRVSGIQIDQLDVGDQLRRVVDADIVVGVHGAALTHAAFMRRNAGLLEIMPNEIYTMRQHFKAIAQWRRIGYFRWTNLNRTLHDAAVHRLYVPPHFVDDCIGELARRICTTSRFHRPSSGSAKRKRANVA